MRKPLTIITLITAFMLSLMLVQMPGAFASPGSPDGLNTLGDFVWFDENGDGIKNESAEWGSSGIDGVLVELYIDDGDAVFEPGTADTLEKSMTTGDNAASPDVEHGWYDFVDLGDNLGWWVYIPDSNFDPGGPLEGYEYTGDLGPFDYNGPNPRYVHFGTGPVDYNDADFGFTLKNIVSIGNLVWDDVNGNAVVDAGETGIDGITVELFLDRDGDGMCEPGADDGAAVDTTQTANGGIYQFLNLTPSTAGDPTTFYCVGVVKADLSSAGYGYSSQGGDHNPDQADNDDDGIPSGAYVLSQPFAAIKGGQTTTDSGDPAGYADSSAYMTVDFGFFKTKSGGGPNAVTLSNMNARAGGVPWPLGLMVFGVVGGAFAWRRR